MAWSVHSQHAAAVLLPMNSSCTTGAAGIGFCARQVAVAAVPTVVHLTESLLIEILFNPPAELSAAPVAGGTTGTPARKQKTATNSPCEYSGCKDVQQQLGRWPQPTQPRLGQLFPSH